jgi:GMP synthase-like glutamine amidotransferase
MKIGILETGEVADELRNRHGDYPGMFQRLLRSADPALAFRVYHVTREQLPRDVHECDAWLVTGSRHGVYDPLPWIGPLKRFLRDAYEADVPIVAICFGHQILAEALGGKAKKSDKGWGLGVNRYTVQRKPDWMTGIDDEISLYALHQDQVVEPPADAEVVAGSEFCPYAILAYRGNAMSIQPHPEFPGEYLRDLIEHRRASSFSDEVADAGLATMDAPIDTRQAADWIVNFLKERIRGKRHAS